MSLLLSYWVLIQELYPALTVALLAALKVAAIYLLASFFSWWGRGRSALFRSWLWRVTFCGWLVTLVWVVAPSSLGRLGEIATLGVRAYELPEDVQDYLAHSPQVGWKPFELAPQASRKEFLALAPGGVLPPWVHPADHDNSRLQMQKSWLRPLERWWIPVWLTGAVLLGGWRVGSALLCLSGMAPSKRSCRRCATRGSCGEKGP